MADSAHAFKPFVADEARLPELTLRALVVGALLGIVFGASSVYLALRVGLTVSASVPIAVISITLFRAFSKLLGGRASILENTVVQTTGSAGESIAAGVAFTLSAVYRTERLLKDNQEKISGDNRSKVESALNDVKEALKGSDTAAIKRANEKLNEAWQTVSAELYKGASEKARAGQGPAGGQSGTQPEAGSAPEGSQRDEGPIIDAEVVDERKAA